MKVTINELNSCKRGMEVEVPPEVVSSEMTKAFETYQRSARIPGFRRGKIPLSVVKQRFGKQVEGEVLSRLIEEFAHRALEEKRIEPIHHPVLDEYDYRQGEPFVFRTTFEVRPALKVEGYRALEVKRSEAEVPEGRVEAALASLRERAAKFSTREGRRAEPGDVVVGSLSGRFLEGKGKNFQDEPITMTAGAEENHPDFNAALAGIGAGEARTFQVRYPDEYPSGNLAGRLVEYVLASREVKVKELPELDDELAKEIGDFRTLEDLRGHVRQELLRRERAAADGEAKDKILTALVEKNEFEVPDSLVEAQLDRQMEDAVRALLLQGVDPNRAGVNWKEEREKGRPTAIRRVKAMLILDAIAAQEAIAATTEEVNERLAEDARRQNVTVPALKERLLRKGHLDGLERQFTREKALDFLLDHATIIREGKLNAASTDGR
jgi:trigger factor